MIKIAIRDDDTNFFTQVKDLESVYSKIPNFPISFAVVPAVTDVSTVGLCPETRNNKEPQYIGNNKPLCDWLRSKVSSNQCDILMHGIHHEYKFINGHKYAEMEWLESDSHLTDTICFWKNKLSEEFDYNISCFVAPSNVITRKCLQAVYLNKLNYSGILPINFQRDITYKSIKNYLLRWYIRAYYKLPYPDVLDYGTHMEINAINSLTFTRLNRMFSYCLKNDSPMVINVHYWDMREHKEKYIDFFKFINYAIDNGAIPTKLTDLLR